MTDNANRADIRDQLPTWDYLQKAMVWEQLDFIENKRILDFGSGEGFTASHIAKKNTVIAVEPDRNMIEARQNDDTYTQLEGSLDILKEFEPESFDVVLCHNVFEYVVDRQSIMNEFSRILKTQGFISLVKHNRAGRVMQMVALLNNFEHAHQLLDGEDSTAQKFGTIHYYTDEDLLSWSNDFILKKKFGIRTFWALQQNQDIHKDVDWQTKMLSVEARVSELDDYMAVASFHHLFLEKK